MDFFELVSNYEIQLKKHFRSYPEMISFSSKYFYDDTLQVMKIRGLQLDEIIVFEFIDHDNKSDPTKNTNSLEAKHIVKELERLLDDEIESTVGVITPHTEQQTYLTNLIYDHPKIDEFIKRFKIKIMTFDSCQGEERDIIYYSFVATLDKDRLSYIFPKDLQNASEDEIDRNLRMQRLNVGFSRAKEKIVFICSKNIHEYSSSLKTALNHYQNKLESASILPNLSDVDPNSEQEKKGCALVKTI